MIKYLKSIRQSYIALKCLLKREKASLENQREMLDENYKFFSNVIKLNSKIAPNSYISDNTIIHNSKVGKFCSIGPNCIIGYGNHPITRLSTSPVFYSKLRMFKTDFYHENANYFGTQEVKIGNDVWIGSGVFIKNGIEIGNGAIIGANSTIIDNVPAYAVVVGSPGKIIKFRFSPAMIENLEKLAWWTWPDDVINKNSFLFSIEDEAKLGSKIKDLVKNN